MKALVWVANNSMRIETAEIPVPKPGWVVLRVAMSGICGSEVSAYQGKNELRRPPLIMGHEFSGYVKTAGEGVPDEIIGKLVAVNPLITCGRCTYCTSGRRHLCADRKIVGAAFPGSFAEFVAVPYESCHPVKTELAGALSEPLATAIRAVDRCNVKTGDRAAVFGMGIIGLLITKLLSRKGAGEICTVDINDSRLGFSRDAGATRSFNISEDAMLGELQKFAGEGVDISFDAVGIETTRSLAIKVLRRGGSSVYVGNHEQFSSIDANMIVRGELSVNGSYAYSDMQFGRAVRLAEEGFISEGSNWLDIMPLTEGDHAFRLLASNSARHSKILLRP